MKDTSAAPLPVINCHQGNASGPSVSSTPRFAFVTLVTSDTFVIGARVLLFSLKETMKATSERPDTVVLVTSAVSPHRRKELGRLCDVVLEVEAIANPNAPHVDGWAGDAGFTKLRIWSLTQYERIVYLDADCLVVDDLHELLMLETDFAAAPDVFPPDRFNAGVLVCRPSESVLSGLLSQMASVGSYDGGDTGFLNRVYADWFTRGSDARLPFRYNAQRTLYWMTHERNPGYWDACKPLKVLHYCSSPKPWEDAKKKGDLEMLWWQTFVRMQLHTDFLGGVS